MVSTHVSLSGGVSKFIIKIAQLVHNLLAAAGRIEGRVGDGVRIGALQELPGDEAAEGAAVRAVVGVGLFGKAPVADFLGSKAAAEEVGEVVIPVADRFHVLAVDNGSLMQREEANDRKVV